MNKEQCLIDLLKGMRLRAMQIDGPTPNRKLGEAASKIYGEQYHTIRGTLMELQCEH